MQNKQSITRFFTTKQILFGLLLFIVSSAISTSIAIAITAVLYGEPSGNPQEFLFAHPWPGLAVGMAFEALISYFGYKYLVRKREHRKPIELEYRDARKELVLGLLIGAVYVSLSVFILTLSGAYKITGISLNTGIIVGLMLGIGAGFAEELFFRGFLLRLLDNKYGPAIAITIVSIAFGFVHLINGDVSVWGVVAIIVENGLFLNVAYYLTRRLWLVIGLHIAWNFALGGIYGLVISGVSTGGGLFANTLTGPDWLTGGSNGPEASIVMVGLAAAIGMMLFMYSRKNTIE